MVVSFPTNTENVRFGSKKVFTGIPSLLLLTLILSNLNPNRMELVSLWYNKQVFKKEKANKKHLFAIVSS